IATGWKCTNCHRTHQSSIRRSDSGSTRARPELTTATSRLPRNWSAPCPVSSGKCKTILTLSDRICVLFADRNVPLIMRGCLEEPERGDTHLQGRPCDFLVIHQVKLILPDLFWPQLVGR